ncbi:hypothetical protein ACLOJK_029355 [Asimina triloba]
MTGQLDSNGSHQCNVIKHVKAAIETWDNSNDLQLKFTAACKRQVSSMSSNNEGIDGQKKIVASIGSFVKQQQMGSIFISFIYSTPAAAAASNH